jgi:hypothetical protein
VLGKLVTLLRGEMAKIKIKQVEVSEKETAELDNAIEQL